MRVTRAIGLMPYRQKNMWPVHLILAMALGVWIGAQLAGLSAVSDYSVCLSYYQMVGEQALSPWGLFFSSLKYFLLLWICSSIPFACYVVFFIRGVSVSYFVTLLLILGQVSNWWFFVATLVFQILLPFPMLYLFSHWISVTKLTAKARRSTQRFVITCAFFVLVIFFLMILSFLEAAFLNRWLLFYPIS